MQNIKLSPGTLPYNVFLAHLTTLIVCLAFDTVTHNLTYKAFAILVHIYLDASKHNYNNCAILLSNLSLAKE